MKNKGNSILMKLLSAIMTVSFLLGFATMFTVQAKQIEIWDGTVADSFASGSGTEDDPYIIETASQLAYFANSKQSFSDRYIKLVNDIYLNNTSDWENWETTAPENEWIPIGALAADKDNLLNFSGNFDGDNHTVYGIYTVGRKHAGLFAYSEGYIKNITVKESFVSATVNAGGIVGVGSLLVENCHNYATVKSSDKAGGIVGYSKTNTGHKAVITKSSNQGKVISEHGHAGGICGYSYSYYSYERTYRTTISLCYNKGTISGRRSGGITGRQDSVIISSTTGVYGETFDCYNIGDISAAEAAGGICGFLYLDQSRNLPKSIQRVYNISKVLGDVHSGQIVGEEQVYNSSDSYTYNPRGYYYNPIATMQFGIGSAESDCECVCLSKSNALLKESYEDFDFDTVWTMDGNVDFPYPKLRDNFQAHEHSYTPDITEADCTEDVTVTYTCVCGDNYTENLDSVGHNYVETIESEGSCTEAKIVKFTCSRCSDFYTETTPATGHKSEVVIINATCTDNGQSYEKCSLCGVTLGNVTVIPATGHIYTSNETTKASCLTPGVMTYTCNCGDTYTKAIPATGHNLTLVVKDSTCTLTGQKYTVCENCGNIIGDIETIPLKNHDYKEEIIPATCTKEGLATYTCTCDASYEEIIPIAPHTPITVKGYSPTCTNTGLTDGSVCDVCKQMLNEQQIIDATGHSYSEKIETSATCTKEGRKTFTCHCGDSYSEAIPIIPHRSVNVKGYAPTCTNTGLTDGIICGACQQVIVAQQTISATGHSYKEEIEIPATCTSEGKKVYTCHCGETYDKVIPSLGHIVGEWKVTTEPTYEKEGVKTLYCAVCGEVIKTESISVLNTKVLGMKLDRKNVSINRDDTLTLTPEIEMGGTPKYTVTYSSSNEKVATVDDSGNVTGKIKGNAVITCTVTDADGRNFTDTCNVTVNFTFGHWLLYIICFGWIWM